ncbi:MAG: response regulator transcription factor [Balneolales bacterium]
MKILVIEDDYVVRSLIERVLDKHGHEVESVEHGQEGETRAIQNGYDCIILDLALPDKNGIEVCRNIRANEVQTPVLILSAHKTTDSKVTGLNTGADDYLTKPFENEELLARIEAVTRRTRDQSNGVKERLQFGELNMDLIKREFTVNGEKIWLTNNEFNLLAYFLKNPERVIGKDELTKNVWEVTFDTQTNFLNVYISYLRKKINEVTSKNYIQTVRKKGFILKGD